MYLFIYCNFVTFHPQYNLLELIQEITLPPREHMFCLFSAQLLYYYCFFLCIPAPYIHMC